MAKIRRREKVKYLKGAGTMAIRFPGSAGDLSDWAQGAVNGPELFSQSGSSQGLAFVAPGQAASATAAAAAAPALPAAVVVDMPAAADSEDGSDVGNSDDGSDFDAAESDDESGDANAPALPAAAEAAAGPAASSVSPAASSGQGAGQAPAVAASAAAGGGGGGGGGAPNLNGWFLDAQHAAGYDALPEANEDVVPEMGDVDRDHVLLPKRRRTDVTPGSADQ